jgi:hypothetical protein
MRHECKAPPRLLPMLAELVSRGDGTFILKPRVTDEDGETWLTPQQTGEVLGRLHTKSVYKLLGEFLVFRRPLPHKILISLRSVLALKQATGDADFWDDRELQKRLVRQVKAEMARRVEESLSTTRNGPARGQGVSIRPRCVPDRNKR